MHLPKPHELQSPNLSLDAQDLDTRKSRMSFHTEALDWNEEMCEVRGFQVYVCWSQRTSKNQADPRMFLH